MKLLDILAAEWMTWPDGVTAIEQDLRGNCLYEAKGPALTAYVEGVADDAETAVVTRAQWQTAVDALKSDDVVAWKGEGLPPVGTVCERRTHSEAQGGRYEEVRIIAYTSNGFPVWENTDGMFSGISKTQRMGEYPEFRPIRTPEQVKQQEHDDAVAAMLEEFPGLPAQNAIKIICAGYRKQVKI